MRLWIRYGTKSVKEFQRSEIISREKLLILEQIIEEYLIATCPKVKKLEFRVFDDGFFDMIYEGIVGDNLSDFPIRKVSYRCPIEFHETFIALNNKIVSGAL